MQRCAFLWCHIDLYFPATGEDRMPTYHPKDRTAQGFVDMSLTVGIGLVTRDSVEDSQKGSWWFVVCEAAGQPITFTPYLGSVLS